MRCDRFPRLSMAWLDDEITADERRDFEAHIETCPACRAELEKLRGVKEVTTRMKMIDLEEKEWDLYWSRIYNRLERKVGWIFFSVGAMVVIAYGLYLALGDLFTDDSIPLFLRAGIGCALLGIVILFVSVARQRLFSWRRDPYREVKQ